MKKFVFILLLGFLQISSATHAIPDCKQLVSKIASPIEHPLAPLFILSGPSGAGKTTILNKLLEDPFIKLHVAVAVTTRAPRPGEVDGVHYHFWTKEKFDSARKNSEFIESTEVHGNFYGTLKAEVEPFRKKGIGVVLNIDVEGRKKMVEVFPEAVSIFVKPSSLAILESRLRGRNTETEANIQKRLGNAKKELDEESSYNHSVINDNLSEAVDSLRTVISTHVLK